MKLSNFCWLPAVPTFVSSFVDIDDVDDIDDIDDVDNIIDNNNAVDNHAKYDGSIWDWVSINIDNSVKHKEQNLVEKRLQ